jgi:hypothetical protein
VLDVLGELHATGDAEADLRRTVEVAERFSREVVARLRDRVVTRLLEQDAAQTQSSSTMTECDSMPDFPRTWDLYAFLLPRKVRVEVFEPCQEELKQDFLLARRLCRTRDERRWLTFCFSVRTMILIGQSVQSWMGDRAIQFLKGIGLAILGNGALQVLRGLFK